MSNLSKQAFLSTDIYIETGLKDKIEAGKWDEALYYIALSHF